MATVRRPSSFAARKMRMAISLRLAASSLRIVLVFFISEAVIVSREILHCFTAPKRLGCSLFCCHEANNWMDRANVRLLGVPVSVEEQGQAVRRALWSPILTVATEF